MAKISNRMFIDTEKARNGLRHLRLLQDGRGRYAEMIAVSDDETTPRGFRRQIVKILRPHRLYPAGGKTTSSG